jgi:hypothetical protein
MAEFKHRSTLAGALFIAAGLLLLGAQVGWWAPRILADWWPVGVIAVGISRGVLVRDGFTWIGYGVLLLLWTTGVWSLRDSWPLLLVVHGLALTFWPSGNCGAGRGGSRVS